MGASALQEDVTDASSGSDSTEADAGDSAVHDLRLRREGYGAHGDGGRSAASFGIFPLSLGHDARFGVRLGVHWKR